MVWNQQGAQMSTFPKANEQGGRVEICDPAVFNIFDLRLSESASQQIRQLEESILTADERLGTFRVG